MQKILSVANDAKTIKGEKYGYRTHVLYFASGDSSGHEVCAWRNAEGTKVCLDTAGRGNMLSVKTARIKKTKRYFADKKKFISDLEEEIETTAASAIRAGYIPVYRLDGTSDIGLAQRIAPNFPILQFYDYTKNFKRKPLANWDITYSYDGFNWDKCVQKLSGLDCKKSHLIMMPLYNVGPMSRIAMVFRDKLPETYRGWPVVDGDKSDLRFLDKKNVIVGLKIKGGKKRIAPNFFVETNQQMAL